MAVVNTPITKDELMKPLRLSTWDQLVIDTAKDASQLSLRITTSEPNTWPSHEATYGFMSRFPQRQEVGLKSGTQWNVPSTDISAQLITELWPESQVKMSPDAEIVIRYLITTVRHQQIAMHRTAEYREYLALKPMITMLAAPTQPIVRQYTSHSGLDLMLHQDIGLANCLHTDGYGLFMEQGTGKTPIVVKRVDLEAPVISAKHGRMYRCIIVAPKNVRQNWATEFERFSNVAGKVTVLRGGEFKRMKQFFEAMVKNGRDELQYTIVVCSYECLSGKTWELISKLEWDLAVLDEAHYIKGSQTKRSKSAIELRDIANARMVLTGTPVCNSVFDLFSLFEFMREGGSGFTSREAFCKFYGVYEARDPARGTKRLSGVQNLPFMKERLARCSFIVKKSEALPDLPEKVYDIYEVEMTERQAEIYNQVRDDLTAEIERDLADETKQLNADNILVKLLRLAQITSGFISFDPIIDNETGEVLSARQIDKFEPNPKIEALVEILKDKEPTEKTIVWAHFKQDISSIMERLRRENIDAVEFRGGTREADREENVRRFNCDTRCKVLVGNPGAGGTGINLLGYDYTSDKPHDTDCTHEIYYSQDWSHPKRSQSEDRCHRKGTRRNVRITDLTVLGTVDEEIRARVTNKRESALQVQDLREILKRILGR